MGAVIIAFGVGIVVGIFLTLVTITLANKKETKILDAEIKRLEKEYLEKYGRHKPTYQEMYESQLNDGGYKS